MSELTDAMGTGITGRPTVTEDSSLSAIMGELVRTAGSAAGAARLLGVSPTTFYRWRNAAAEKERGIRQQPKLGKRAMVTALRNAQTPPGRRRELIRGDKRMVIKATVIVSNDERDRTIHVGSEIPPQKMGNVIRSWLAGDDDRADRLLDRHIDENYVEGMRIAAVHDVEFR